MIEAPPRQSSLRSQSLRSQQALRGAPFGSDERRPIRPGLPGREDSRAAADVAAAIVGGGTVVAVGAAIIPAMPLPTLSLLGPDLGGAVAREVAEIALQEIPERPVEPGAEAGSAGARAFGEWLEELTYRGLYAIAAARRIAVVVAVAEKAEERLDALRGAVEAEARFFRQHREAAKRRGKSRERLREAVRKYGDVLSWRHGNPKEPRPSHLAADGKNFRPAEGPPNMTGAMPGVLPGCTCDYGPRVSGADMMI